MRPALVLALVSLLCCGCSVLGGGSSRATSSHPTTAHTRRDAPRREALRRAAFFRPHQQQEPAAQRGGDSPRRRGGLPVRRAVPYPRVPPPPARPSTNGTTAGELINALSHNWFFMERITMLGWRVLRGLGGAINSWCARVVGYPSRVVQVRLEGVIATEDEMRVLCGAPSLALTALGLLP